MVRFSSAKRGTEGIESMTAYGWLDTLIYLIIALLPGLAFWWGLRNIDNIIDFNTKIKRGRHRCQNCHFLIKGSPQLSTRTWDEKDRKEKFPRIRIPPDKLEHGGWEGISGYDMTVGCFKEIWTDDHNEMSDDSLFYRDKSRELEKKVTVNRGESCFFVPYHEGMSMINAEELFRDNSENRRTNKRLFWMKIGIAISFLTALWSVYLHYAAD